MSDPSPTPAPTPAAPTVEHRDARPRTPAKAPRGADPVDLAKLVRDALKASTTAYARKLAHEHALAVLLNPVALKIVLDATKLGPVPQDTWDAALVLVNRSFGDT